jgi:hypothetical protein
MQECAVVISLTCSPGQNGKEEHKFDTDKVERVQSMALGGQGIRKLCLKGKAEETEPLLFHRGNSVTVNTCMLGGGVGRP